MKLPAMQFYPGDWWKDPGVSALSCEERGIWFQMILLMFEGEQRGRLTLNGKPMPVEALARVIGLETPRLREGLTHIIEYGVASVDEDGSIYSRRMIRDEEARAKAKIDGKKGGNPTLIAKQDNPPLNPPVKPKPTPSSSSSSSSSSSEYLPAPAFDREAAFEELWLSYPAKGRTRKPMSQQYYLDAVATLPDDQQQPMHARILAPVLPGGKWAKSAQWAKGFVQALPVYLNQTQWLESPEQAEQEIKPGNYDHLPLGFTQAEKDKMARVARERAEDGLV